MLFVAGQLNPAHGRGQATKSFVRRAGENHFYVRIDVAGPEFDRRSVYRAGYRSAGNPLLDVHGLPRPVPSPRQGAAKPPRRCRPSRSSTASSPSGWRILLLVA